MLALKATQSGGWASGIRPKLPASLPAESNSSAGNLFLYIASFVGFAPAQHPKLLVAVVVDQPLYVHFGGAVAAPVFGEIASFALPYLGISPN